ncbi:RDD family protein [Moraxella oblonga]|uniref:RDD family protein n=1 Tax=Moraxella oblonga TaxID=200413 RepID=UPI000A727672|nr:RDD family protein [Moraxella oblonga]
MSKNTPQSTTPPHQHPTTNDSETLVIAKPVVRLMAVVYDGMLILASLFLVGTILSVVGTILLMDVGETAQQAKRLPLWYQNGVMTPAFVLTLVGFYGLFWRKSGQTLGMQTWRLQTVTSGGQLLTWGQSFRRIFSACLLPLLCATVGGVLHGSRLSILMSAFLGFLCNYLFCILNRQGLSAHDIMSNTMTLKIPKHQHASIFERFKRK